jgi:hypothetical protein
MDVWMDQLFWVRIAAGTVMISDLAGIFLSRVVSSVGAGTKWIEWCEQEASRQR